MREPIKLVVKDLKTGEVKPAMPRIRSTDPVERIRADERERCAKFADESGYGQLAHDLRNLNSEAKQARMLGTTVETKRKGKTYRSARELQQNLIAEIQACENRAHKLGLHVTAHALNRAKNAVGWELAGDTEKAGMASRDERPVR